MITTILDPAVVEEIGRIARDRSPNEACGVILPVPHKQKRVWEMPNRSLTPFDSFELHGVDLAIDLEDWEGDMHDLVFWHTHPRGHVGPSRYDLENRLENLGNLVVTITEEGKTLATWY